MTQPPSNLAKSHVVRVFISSTFRDMQEERDELAKVIFPELKAFCREREVEFVEVDLRWGVTEEQAQHGETLRLCLEEIQRCRPYFIGLLGERYGWVPEKISEDDREDYPWIEVGSSVTELEILHGVLNDPAMARRARFYFRDLAYAEGRGSDFLSESPQAAEKLKALKERIRKSGLPVMEDYPDPQSVAKQIGEELRQAIAAEYPEGTEAADPLERDAEDHEAFAKRRERVYIGREVYFQRLEAFVEAEVAPDATSTALLVTGGSGGGKSALLANWARRHRQRHADDFLLLHFIGSTPASADYEAVLRRVMGELKRKFEIKDELPRESEGLKWAFPNWLARAGATAAAGAVGGSGPLSTTAPMTGESSEALLEKKIQGFKSIRTWFKKLSHKRHLASQVSIPELKKNRLPRIILVLDGLNQLEDRDAAPELGWLPEVFPGNVRVIVSTLPGRSLEVIQRRGHEELRIEPLSVPERKELIEKYLGQFRKQLDKKRLKRIARAKACANPLYLRVLLEELRLFGSHEKLSESIEFYLKAQTIECLYQKVLARLETDYDPSRRGIWQPPENMEGGMVGEALSLIWAARRGLTENELLELLGESPRVAWSPLFLALEEVLVEQRGVLNFFHDYLRKAVEARYLANMQKKKVKRQKLAVFFSRQLYEESYRQVGVKDSRALDELPWLWRMAEEWQKLYDLLSDMFTFNALWEKDETEFKMGWAAIEAGSELRKINAYRKVLAVPQFTQFGALWNLAKLFRDTGNPEEALGIHAYLTKMASENGETDFYQMGIGDQANLLFARGDLDEAMRYYREQERLCRQSNTLDLLQSSLGGQAVIFLRWGNLNEAMTLLREQERICRQLGLHLNLAQSLGNQAKIQMLRGDLDGAMALHNDQDHIFRQLGHLDLLPKSLGDQALIFLLRGKYDEAMEYYKEGERISRQLGNLDGLQMSLGGQAMILIGREKYDGAMALLKDQERICQQIGNHLCLAQSLGNQGTILWNRGKRNEAMALVKEKERICRKLGDPEGLAQSLTIQGAILVDQNRKPDGRLLAQQALEIAERHGYTALAMWIKKIIQLSR